MKRKNWNKIINVLVLVLLTSCGLFYVEPEGALTSEEAGNQGYIHEGRALPYFGPVTVEEGDSLFYQIPKFYLTAENGEGLGYSFYEGSIMVVDFFFTSCSTICPLMTSGMKNLQDSLAEEGLMGKVKFLSVTIDPDSDTPEALQSYAVEKGADAKNWRFATRDIEYVDELSKNGFFLAVDRNETYQDGIIHSSQLILVDSNRHIRGSYDGIDVDEMNDLRNDIKALLNE